MGKMNTITKDYMSEPKYFADSFNYYLFDGKQVSDKAKEHRKKKDLRDSGEFQSVDIQTVRLLNVCTNSKIPIVEGEEKVNMCKGLDDLMEKHRREAKAEERADLVKKKLAKGCSVEQIADALETTIDTIQDIISGLQN